MGRKELLGIATILVVVSSFAGSTMVSARIQETAASSRSNVVFDQYYTHAELAQLICKMERAFPHLVRVFQIGKSMLGKDLWALEITNRKLGNPLDKPAFLAIGPHHGDETIGVNVVAYFAWYLLVNFGKDCVVTEVLNEKTVYVIPMVNPDGNDITLLRDIYGRYNARPMDEDFDGLLDEDDPEDLNGDGKITDMRQWNPAINDYDWYFEGIDNDGDGWINEDWYGGVDLNRNFDFHWKAVPPDYPQYYGEQAFSEPETQAIRDFVLAHPNIAVGYDTHAGAEALMRPWTHVIDPPPDETVYEALDAKYSNMTGYVAGQTSHVLYPYFSPDNPGGGKTVDWMYATGNLIYYTHEVFGSIYFDLDDPFNETKFFQQYPDAMLDWTKFNHPQLGEVEIGGLWPFRYHNPPENEIMSVCQRNLPMLIDLAMITPDLEFKNARYWTTSHYGYADICISVDLANEGFLATSTQLALLNGTTSPVDINLRLTRNAMLLKGSPAKRFEVIQGGKSEKLCWKIRVKVPSISYVTIEAYSAKGGLEKLLATITTTPSRTCVKFQPVRH